MTETVRLIEVEGHCMYDCDGQASNTTGSYLKFDRFRLDVFLSSGLNNMSFVSWIKSTFEVTVSKCILENTCKEFVRDYMVTKALSKH